MGRICAAMLACCLCGCAHLPFAGKPAPAQKTAEEFLAEKKLECQELQAQLAEQKAQNLEKDRRIQELQEKLRSFGVF